MTAPKNQEPKETKVKKAPDVSGQPLAVTMPKENLVKVRAAQGYNNGNLLDKPWKADEVREIPMELLIRLNNDLPDNWLIVGAHGEL